MSVRLWIKRLWFESSCSHLKFKFRTSFEQGVPWHSGNYRVWTHSETRAWHYKNIQSLSDRIFVKDSGFLSFAENIGKNVGKNISKNLSGK